MESAAVIGRDARVELPRRDWMDRACHLAAFAVTIVWFFVYARRGQLCDEPGHMADVYHFLADKAGWPESMPMLPGYHFIIVTLWKLHPPIDLLTLARLITTLIALLGLAVFAFAWQRFRRQPRSDHEVATTSRRADGAGRATLLFALLPLTQPFNGMVYTDVPAVVFALFGWWAHVSGWRAFAALLLAAAAAVRQTNLAWAGFIIAWEFLRTDVPRRDFFQRTRWQFLLLAVAIATVAIAGRLTVGVQHGNDFRLNTGTIHFAGVIVLLLGLPVWIAHAPAVMRRWLASARAHPMRAGAIIGTAGIVAGVLAATFSNPHIWNRDLFWPGCTFTLLRNWPLVWIDTHPWLRVCSGINLVLMGTAVVLAFSRQKYRRELWLALACSALVPLTNSLVEPRYFIPGAVFILFFLDLDRSDWRRLAWWWAFLSALHAPFVALNLSLW